MARFTMGSAWVEVHADTSRLRPEVKRAADLAGRDAAITAHMSLDTTQADTTAARLRQKIDRTEAKMRVGVDDRGVDADTQRVGGRVLAKFESLGRSAGAVLSGALSSGVISGAGAAASGADPLLTVFGSLAAGAAAVAGSVLALVPALQLLGGGFGVALVGGFALVSVLATLVLGFGGVFKALKAHSAMQDQAAASGVRMVSQERANAVAVRTATEAISDARRRQADVAGQVAQRIRAAEARIADAAERSTEAQQRLNEARKQAKQRIEDLARAAAASARDEERARMRLTEARDRVALIESHLQVGTGEFSPEDLKRARDDVRRAELDLADARDQNTAKQKEATKAGRDGVDGDKQVIAAKKAVQKAAQDEAAAQAALTAAKRDGARAQEDANIAVARAVRGLSDLRAQQAEQTKAQQAGTGAANTFRQAYDKLTPAGKAFVDQLLSMRGHLDALKRTAQSSMLPGVTAFLKDADRLFPIVNTHVGNMGRILGSMFRDLGTYLSTDLFKRQLTTILGNVEKFTDHVADATVEVFPALVTIAEKASPLLEKLGGWIEKGAEKFADWIDSAEKSGALEDFFDGVAETFADLSEIGGLVWGILGDIIAILWDPAKKADTSVLGGVKDILGKIKTWLDDDGNQQKVRDWITDIKQTSKDLAQQVLPALGKAADGVGKAIKWVQDHPAAAATLLAILAGYKGLSSITGLKLPDLLGKAFEQFLGRGSALNPMFVAVVNEGFGAIPGKGKGPAGAGAGKGGAVSGALMVLGGVTAATLAVDTILGKPGSSLGGFKALLMGPESYSEWSKKNAPGFQRFFSMTLPGWLTAGGTRGWSSFRDAFYNDAPALAHWFSITLPNSINLGSSGSGGWAGLATNLGKWFGETLPGHLSLGEGKGWSGLLSSTGRWFSHTLPDALNLGQGSGWSGIKDDLGNWFGQTLPDALSPGSGGGWTGAGKRWKEQAKSALGINLIQGLWDGIAEKTSGLSKKIGEWRDQLVGWFKARLGIKSPSTVFHSIGSDIMAGLWGGVTSKWNALTKSVNTFITDTVGGKLKSGFRNMAAGVRSAFIDPFSLIPQHLLGPMNAVRTFINGAIGKVNAIIPGSSVPPNIPTIPEIKARSGMGNRAAGGPIFGPGTGTSDDVPIWGSNGEWVIREQAVKTLERVFGSGIMHRLNNADRVSIGGDPSVTTVRGYAGGGLISRTQQFIRGTDPLPYIWAAVGPHGYDCSGLTGEVYNRLLGLASFRRRFVTASNFESMGFRPGKGAYTIGVGPGHMAGNLAGLAFEAASSRSGIKVGGSARSVTSFPRQYYLPQAGGQFIGGGGGQDPGWWTGLARTALTTALRPFTGFLNQMLPNDGSFTQALRSVGTQAKDRLVDRVTSFDTGGGLPPGWTLAHNGTGRTETVRTADQEAALHSPGEVHYHFAPGAIQIEARTIAELRDVSQFMDMIRNVQPVARQHTGRRAVFAGRP